MTNTSPLSTDAPRPSLSSIFGQCLLAILLIAALATYWVGLQQDHERKITALERQTQLRSAQLAKTLAVQAQTLFSGLDFVAQNLSVAYAEGNAAGFDLAVRTATATYPSDSILQIAVANQQGRVVYSNLQNPPTRNSGASIADREHFLVHAQSAQSGLYISQPLMGRVSNLWTIQISRAIRLNGTFEGVVVISVAPSYLSSFFREILELPNDVIMLLRADGAYMARSRAETNVLGKFVPSDREFLKEPSRTSGFYDVISPVDHIARHYAWHRVATLPLVLSIGLDKNAVWAPLQEEIRNSQWRNAISSALLVLAALVIGWLSFQSRKAKALAARSQELLRNLVTQVPGALFQLRLQTDGSVHLPYATPSLYKLHHVAPLSGQHDFEAIFATFHPEDAQRLRTELRDAPSQLTAWQGRYQIDDGTGATRWMHYTVKPEQCADGSVLFHGYVQDITQEQEMQQALRTSEQHLRLTMDAVHDGLWQWSIEDNAIQWDARCWDMLGYPSESGVLTLETMLDWMHPSDRERFTWAVQAHLDRGAHYHSEFRLRTRQGTWVWIEARGNVTETVDGKPMRMFGTHTDISERVAQAQLRRVLLDESAAAILLVTSERTITQANRRAKNMFATAQTPLSGQSLGVIHPDSASFEAFSTCYDELRQHGYVRREWLCKMANGQLRWCDIHGTLLDPQDLKGQVIWTVIDTDDRYRAEHELRIAKQRLTAIIERFPGGVMVQESLYGPIVAINQEFSEVLKLSPTETSVPPDLEAKVRALLPPELLLEPEQLAPGQTSAVHSVERTFSNGRTFEIHRIALGDAQQALGLFWVLRDITQTKQRETALEHLASTDTLTALPNRRAFMARLQQELNAVRSGESTPGVLVMLDIDFFKRVNDSWGHAVGDRVLEHLAALLRQSLRLRSGDMAARLGGEEFAVLLASTDLPGGLQLAERLRELIASTPYLAEHGPIAFTASLGLSVLDGTLAHIDQGLERADAALYYAKRHGRNQVRVWNAQMVITQSAASS